MGIEKTKFSTLTEQTGFGKVACVLLLRLWLEEEHTYMILRTDMILREEMILRGHRILRADRNLREDKILRLRKLVSVLSLRFEEQRGYG